MTVDAGWIRNARCADEDPYLFTIDPPAGSNPQKHAAYDAAVAAAKRVCTGCEVRAACLTFGMREPGGVYGGLTAGERKALKKRMTLRKKGTGPRRSSASGTRPPASGAPKPCTNATRGPPSTPT